MYTGLATIRTGKVKKEENQHFSCTLISRQQTFMWYEYTNMQILRLDLRLNLEIFI